MIHNDFNKQAAIDSSLENGVINIDKLIACNDFETIKEGLNNYPLTINEYLKQLYKNGDYRSIFRWAVDNNAKLIANYLIDDNISIFEDKKTTFDDVIDYAIAELKGKGKRLHQ